MLQRLPIAYAQVKAGNTSENLINEMRQFIILCIERKNTTHNEFNNTMNTTYTTSIQQHNEFNKVIKRNGCFIYEF